MPESTEIKKKGPITAIKKWYKDVSFFEVLAILFIIIGALVIIGVFIVANPDSITHSQSKDILDYSEFLGGFVGSLWALAGVLLFYASLGSQKAELDDQRKLLVKQIDEIVKQTEESRKQNEMFKQQQVEETFFQLMRFQNEIVSTIVLETSEMDFSTGKTIQKELVGRNTFGEYYDVFKRFYQDASDRMGFGMGEESSLQKNVDSAYRQFYNEYQSALGHYFRNLKNILIFIDELGGHARKFYLDLLLAQLSNYELGLLFFHALYTQNKEYKELVEKYSVLTNVPNDELTQIAYILYNDSAFGEGGFDLESGMSYGEDIGDNEAIMEEGFLSSSNLLDNDESDWDIDSDVSDDEIIGNISGKLSGLKKSNKGDTDNNSKNTQQEAKKKNEAEAKSKDNIANTEANDFLDLDIFGGSEEEDIENSEQAEPIDRPDEESDDESEKQVGESDDWSKNMLSLDDVATGWEDGGDNIESDETSSYADLEDNIEVYSKNMKAEPSKMANLKEAFSDLSENVAKQHITDDEYNKLFFKDGTEGNKSGIDEKVSQSDEMKEEATQDVKEETGSHGRKENYDSAEKHIDENKKSSEDRTSQSGNGFKTSDVKLSKLKKKDKPQSDQNTRGLLSKLKK